MFSRVGACERSQKFPIPIIQILASTHEHLLNRAAFGTIANNLCTIQFVMASAENNEMFAILYVYKDFMICNITKKL